MNPNASFSTPSAEGSDEPVAHAKDGELFTTSLDLIVHHVLYRSRLPRSHELSLRSLPCEKGVQHPLVPPKFADGQARLDRRH